MRFRNGVFCSIKSAKNKNSILVLYIEEDTFSSERYSKFEVWKPNNVGNLLFKIGRFRFQESFSILLECLWLNLGEYNYLIMDRGHAGASFCPENKIFDSAEWNHYIGPFHFCLFLNFLFIFESFFFGVCRVVLLEAPYIQSF